MFSFEDLEKLRQAMSQLLPDAKNEGAGENTGHGKKNKNKGKERNQADDKDGTQGIGNCINLTPSQLLIIAGFLTGVLEVYSVLVNKNQSIEIVLTGTLRKRTQLEKVMEQVGKMPFDRVVQAIMENNVGF